MKSRFALVLTAVALGLAACGGDDEEPAADATPTAASGGGGGDVVEIKMKDIQFQPADADVKLGQTVRWPNEDTVDHNAVADDGTFKSELYGQGKSFEWKADKVGTIKYVCTVHPGMDGVLNVTE